jgi:leader peptidase (prepilin peptidase) / N-methyltransferase
VTGARLAAVGLAAAGLVAASFARFGLSGRAFVAAFVVVVLVVLSAIDLEQRIIPNRIVLPATAVVLAARIALSPGRTLEWIGAGLAAAAFLLLVHLVQPEGLGMGDVKLALLIGAALGRYTALGMLAGMLAAAAVAIVVLVREGRAGRKKAIPYGPFLAFGAILALFLDAP